MFLLQTLLWLAVAELLGRRLRVDTSGLQVERNLASGAKNLFMPHELVAEQVIISCKSDTAFKSAILFIHSRWCCS